MGTRVLLPYWKASELDIGAAKLPCREMLLLLVGIRGVLISVVGR